MSPLSASTFDDWDRSAEVVIVGFGCAGACAALEANYRGAEVLILERFNGGGATAISGGVVYGGGGTRFQEAAGVIDTPEEMFRYLKAEGTLVSDETLYRFCLESRENIHWLASLGVPFGSVLCPWKTSYPKNDHHLYYSGSEFAHPYRELAKPAARGHRPAGKGNAGGPLFDALRSAVSKANIPVATQCRVKRLITGPQGEVRGVECLILPPAVQRKLCRMAHLIRKWQYYYPAIGQSVHEKMETLENKHGKCIRIEARKGVILSAGGFIFNRDMVGQLQPKALAASPLGTTADDGSGIHLGQSVGGSVEAMERISVWRFFNPPYPFVKGIVVGSAGQRLGNETLYGARIGRQIMEAGGTAWLIADQAVVREAWRKLLPQTVFFQRLTAVYLLTLGHKRGRSPEQLARRINVAPEVLRKTVEEYNNGARAARDRFGKEAKVLQVLQKPPFFAFDLSIGASPFFPSPSLTLGGLVVDESTGQVIHKKGGPIPGLYAAGRNAVGICSAGYVSGLSLADAVFSGRRAGRELGGG